MSTTSTTATEIQPGQIIRLVPMNKRNRQTITVRKVEPLACGVLVIGTRRMAAGRDRYTDRITTVIAETGTAVEVLG